MTAVTSVEASMPKACPSCGTRYPADALFCSLDGAPLTTSPGAIAAAAKSDPYLGREILGHIEIRQLVGIGAMGRVYRAFQKGIDRDVAVKILHRELSANQTLVARFHREAKVASRLAHPNVVHVLLVGQLPDGAMYIVMEYLDGLSLQSALAAADGAMPLPRALHVALQLCDAAGEAHAQGIVHRDIKPENVMLVKRADDPDYVKVLDFGIARLNWGDQSMATAAGLIFGTARYISPEGAQGEKVGPQGDVYSIATMVYQMLAGRTPFDGDQAVALLVQQIHDPPPPLKSIPRAAYVPEPIASVVMANLVKKPDDRASSARAFGRALLDAAVVSGLSAQDILARPALASGGRGEHATATQLVQMPSMQQTNKLQLEPDVASRIGAEPSRAPSSAEQPARTATKTAYLEPHGARVPVRTEIAEPDALPPARPAAGPPPLPPPLPAPAPQPPPASLAPGVATTKWSPPADFEARLVPPPRPSSVDATMADEQAGIPSLATRPAGSIHRTAPPASVTEPPTSRTAPTAPPETRTAPPASRAPSAVETTMAGEESPERRPPVRARSLALVVVCFLLGALGMGAVAFKAGLIGGRPRTAQVEAVLARANDALTHQRWDAPPGDNVRDITDEGLKTWPHDSRLLGMRSRARDDVLAAAHAKHDAGDGAEAVRLARLASELDPGDLDAQKLVADWSGAAAAAPSEPVLPPLAVARPSISGASAAAVASAGADRAVLIVSNPQPGVAQPVDFTARVVGATPTAHPKVESARFRIAGPGVAPGTELDGADDGSGAYRASFTFLQAGHFEVSFVAHADGAQVRALRTLVVGGAAAKPPASGAPAASSAPSAAPTPSSSAKWL